MIAHQMFFMRVYVHIAYRTIWLALLFLSRRLEIANKMTCLDKYNTSIENQITEGEGSSVKDSLSRFDSVVFKTDMSYTMK